MTVDYADWQAPQAQATAISVTGVPLLTGKSLVANPGLQAVPAAGQYSPGLKSLTQPGYEIYLSCFANAASAVPFAALELAWTDSSSGLVIARDTYPVAAGSNVSGWVTQVTGPTKADSLLATVTNLDAAHSMVIGITVLQNSRVYVHDSVMWDNTANAGNVIPGITLPSLPGDNSCLGFVVGGVIPAAGSVQWLCGHGYSGFTNLAVSFSGVTLASIVITAYPAPQAFYGNVAYALRQVPVSNSANYQFLAQRGPLFIQFSNTAGAAGNVNFSMTLQQ